MLLLLCDPPATPVPCTLLATPERFADLRPTWAQDRSVLEIVADEIKLSLRATTEVTRATGGTGSAAHWATPGVRPGGPARAAVLGAGFVLGLIILVILGELPHLLGVPTPTGQVVERIGALGANLTRGEADLPTVIVSAASLLVLFAGPRFARWVPWGLLVLIGGLVASTALDLQARGIEVVGPGPRSSGRGR